MKISRLFVAVVLVGGFWLGCDGGAESFDAALRRAAENAGTPDGRRYRKQVGNDVVKVIFNAYQDGECKALDEPVEILVRISTTGEMDEVLFRSPNETTLCFGELLRKRSYPEPPGPSYWLRYEAAMQPNAGGYPLPTE